MRIGSRLKERMPRSNCWPDRQSAMIQRKNYLINKKFQFNFLSQFLILLFLESILIMMWFFYISNDTLTTGYINSTLTVETTRNFFSAPFILLSLIIAVGVGLAGMVVFILLSHRIAGPLYRFEMTLKQLQQGDMTMHVNLRKKDQLGRLQEELNVLIRSLDERFSSMKKELDELENLLAQRQDPAVEGKIKSKIERVRQSVNYFKLTQKSTNV